MNALPEWLTNRPTPRIADRAAEGMGGLLPPHISIKGNCFTLIDKAGNKQQLQTTYMETCVIDTSDVMCKQFYEEDWGPNSDNPPDCFSANGIAPSREASKPQSATCAACQWNIRGSDVSMLSGKPIKACRDEKWIAVILPNLRHDMIFQMKVTPGSFKNWKGYTDRFKGQQVDLSDVVTKIAFEAGKNGVLTFEATSYIDQPTAQARNTALQAKATDLLVGRTDQPRALAAPAAAPAIAPAQQQAPVTQNTGLPGGLPQPQQSFAPQQQSFAPFVPPAGAGATAGVTAAPSQPEQPATRRRRRTAAAPAPAPASTPSQPAAAPFRPEQPPQQMEAPFGVGQAVPPNPDLQNAINSVFGKA